MNEINENAVQTAERMFGEIRWETDSLGYVTCPGLRTHTTSNKRKDCRLTLDGVPTLFCLHHSCRNAIEQANRQLRHALSHTTGDKQLMTKIQNHRNQELELLAKRATNSKSRIIQANPWSLAQIEEHTPSIPESEQTRRFLEEMFQPDDIIWLGDIHDSGPKRGAAHFKTLEEWQRCDITGPFVCPNIFKQGSSSRTNENIQRSKYLVVESDTLSKDQVGAVFRWLQTKAGQKLRAIVDTGNKSLHGWFEYPSDSEELEELKVVLPALGCDSKMFTPSQPARLPGVSRQDTGRVQRLIYLATASKEGCV